MSVPSQRVARVRHLRRALRIPFGRRRRAKAWFDQQATDLSGTGTGQVFTADFANDEIDIAAHGHTAGDGPFALTTTTTLPAGLSVGVLYWVSAPTAGALQLHLTHNEAAAGVNPVTFSDAGVGTHTMTPSTTAEALVENIRQRDVSPERLHLLTDIDDIT